MNGNHPKEERTLVLLKPDALQRNLLGEIIHRFERKGLKIIGLKMLKLDDVLMKEHYVDLMWLMFLRTIVRRQTGSGAEEIRRGAGKSPICRLRVVCRALVLYQENGDT